MGYTRHRFFIVHAFDKARASEARGLAIEAFPHAPHLVGPVMDGAINSEHGFIVWTSGSKIGWSDDARHIAAIEALIVKLSAMDGPPGWCRVDSGEEAGDISAEQGNDGDWSHTYERTRIATPSAGSYMLPLARLVES